MMRFTPGTATTTTVTSCVSSFPAVEEDPSEAGAAAIGVGPVVAEEEDPRPEEANTGR